jgi:hypothetical protein
MPDRTILAALLADPARVASVPAAARQAVLDDLAVHEGRCRLVRELLTAGLATAAPSNGTPMPAVVPDELLDVEAAARLIGRSVSWMRHQGHKLHGFFQPGGKGTRALWSRLALQKLVRGEDC